MNQSEFIIRNAIMEDIKNIQKLTQELLESDKNFSSKTFMTKMDWALSQDGYDNYLEFFKESDEYLYVVTYNSDIIGYMTCWVNDQEKWDEYKTFEIGNIYVKKEYRKNGIGTRLVNIAKELCKENNIKFLKINVLKDNIEAQKFYEKNGLYQYAIEQLLEIE